MKYILVMTNGKTMSFYTKEVAEMYRNLNGGFIINIDKNIDNTCVQEIIKEGVKNESNV